MSDSPLHSSAWYRVASLRPRLQARARLHRHRYRGELWYLLQDPASGKVHRFSPEARWLLAAMDGRRTVQELWAVAVERLGDAAPTQDDVLQLLGQLHAADLLTSDASPDALEVFERAERERSTRRRRGFSNPMALRIPLWDPGRFLDRHRALWRWIWGPWGLAVWLLAVGSALLSLPAHWDALTGNLSDRTLQLDNLLLLAVVFPLIKALHEMGHATATAAEGGEVHDMGLMLLVLMPVPYVDASSANVLRSRWRRATIGAAGMLVELFLAALALLVWTQVEPGLVRSVCFNIILVAGVSTLVFNGNPLLRYDAYYILADLLELPNLGQRASRAWGELLQRRLLRIDTGGPAARTAGEQALLLVYGLASTAYRLLVTVAIALFVGSQFLLVGVLIGLWGLAMATVVPLAKALRALAARPEARDRPARTWGLALGWTAAAAALLAVVPLPHRTQAEGVVWAPEQAQLRAGAAGFFGRFLVPPGAEVAAGMPVFESDDPLLRSQLALLQARVDELERLVAQQFAEDRARAAITERQLQHEREALARGQERLAALVVRAAMPGRLTVAEAGDWPGRHHHQGELVAHVLDDRPATVRVVLDQEAVDRVGAATRRIDLWLAGPEPQVLPGRIVRQVPAGRDEAPSAALTHGGGGALGTDPRDPRGLRTLERVFEVDVELLAPPPRALPIGQRVQVRFDHAPSPLAAQAGRALRRLLLRHFDV